MSGVFERPMMPVDLAGKEGARLLGISANGDDRLDVAGKKFIQVF